MNDADQNIIQKLGSWRSNIANVSKRGQGPFFKIEEHIGVIKSLELEKISEEKVFSDNL